jgi:hypothetical protein
LLTALHSFNFFLFCAPLLHTNRLYFKYRLSIEGSHYIGASIGLIQTTALSHLAASGQRSHLDVILANNLDEVFNATLFVVIHHERNPFDISSFGVLCHRDQHISQKSLITTRQSTAAWTAAGEGKVDQRKPDLIYKTLDDTRNHKLHPFVQVSHVVEAKFRQRPQEPIGELAMLLAEERDPPVDNLGSLLQASGVA